MGAADRGRAADDSGTKGRKAPFPQSRAAQAESYLIQAADALTNAGDPRFLWSEAPQRHAGSMLASPQRAGDAGNRRLRALRSSVVFSALAAEAYANDFLAEMLPTVDVEAMDRLPALDKLLLGPKVAGMSPPLDRGREPAQTIRRLFQVRNSLVHPRRNDHGAFIQYLTEEDEAAFGPRAAGRFLRRVSDAILAMENLCPPPSLAGTAALLSVHPEVIDLLVDQIGERIDSYVAEDAERPLDPVEAAERRAMSRARGSDG